MSVADINAGAAANACNAGGSQTPLRSVKIVGRIGYLNSDPAMPFMLPFGAWRVNDLRDKIMLACIDYDIAATWNNAKVLALKLAKEIIRDTIKGGFDVA